MPLTATQIAEVLAAHVFKGVKMGTLSIICSCRKYPYPRMRKTEYPYEAHRRHLATALHAAIEEAER